MLLPPMTVLVDGTALTHCGGIQVAPTSVSVRLAPAFAGAPYSRPSSCECSFEVFRSLAALCAMQRAARCRPGLPDAARRHSLMPSWTLLLG